MLILLSPAKTLDFESAPTTTVYTQPAFLSESQILVEQLRAYSPQDLSRLMDISAALAELNAQRYRAWSLPFVPGPAKQAVLAFAGDVYEGLAAPTLGRAALEFAQQHVRVLSGLYGVLRPLDLILPYRLEMGIALANPRGKDLYAFWGERISEALNAAAAEVGAPAIVNLASVEYFKAVRPKRLTTPVIQPVFEDWSGGRYKVVSFYAKRARGLMARYVIEKRVKRVDTLKKFAGEGYAFDASVSDATRWVFRRSAQTQ